MAGFNTTLEQGRIARGDWHGQSKKLMHRIKGIYSRDITSAPVIVQSRLRSEDGLAHPFRERMLAATVDASRHFISSAAVRADRSRRKSIEGHMAVATLPVFTDRRSVLASGAGIALAARN